MPNNWLNIFSAVRGANQFEADQQQRTIENKRADETQGWAREDQQHQNTDWNTERATRTTLGALGAFSNMADSISNDASITDENRPQAYAQAFDRIAPALAASGFDPQQVDGLRAQLLENPGQASDLLNGLQELSGSDGGSRQGLQAAFDANGRAVFIDPRTGRPAARGFAPATAVLGQDRVAVSQQNADTAGGRLEQQQVSNDPNHAFDVSAAQAEGTVAGQNAARAPEALAAGREVVRRIDTILNTPPEQLADVLGMPSLGGALRGGFGQAGTWPGSQAADIAADIGGLSSSLRSAAYQLVLKGGGSITEAESAFGAEAFVNLQRSQGPAQFRENLMHAREYFSGLLQRYQQQSAPTRNPNRTDGARGGGAASATAAPATAAPAAPSSGGVDVDAYLRDRGF